MIHLYGLAQDFLTKKILFIVLSNLEKNEINEVGIPKIAHSKKENILNQSEQFGLFSETVHPVIKQLEKLEPDNLSPRQAIESLYDLKNLIKKPFK